MRSQSRARPREGGGVVLTSAENTQEAKAMKGRAGNKQSEGSELGSQGKKNDSVGKGRVVKPVEVVRGEARGAKVDELDLDLGVGLDQDILGFDVAVDQVQAVDVRHGLQQLGQRQRESYRERELAAGALRWEYQGGEGGGGAET